MEALQDNLVLYLVGHSVVLLIVFAIVPCFYHQSYPHLHQISNFLHLLIAADMLQEHSLLDYNMFHSFSSPLLISSNFHIHHPPLEMVYSYILIDCYIIYYISTVLVFRLENYSILPYIHLLLVEM